MFGNESGPSSAMEIDLPATFDTLGYTNLRPIDHSSDLSSRYSMSSNGGGPSFTTHRNFTFNFGPVDYTRQATIDSGSVTTKGTFGREEDTAGECIETFSPPTLSNLEGYSDDNPEEENEPFAITYLAGYNALPTYRAPGYPHIIKNNHVTEEEGSGYYNLRAADGVATLLYKYNPAALEDFLNLNKKEFFFWRKEPSNTLLHHTIVTRHGLTVTVCQVPIHTMLASWRSNYPSQAGRVRQEAPLGQGGRWDYMLQYKIKPDGLWKPHALLQMLGQGWTRDFEDIENMGNVFAYKIIFDKRWRYSEGVEMGYSTSGSFIKKTGTGNGPIKLDVSGDINMPTFSYAYKE